MKEFIEKLIGRLEEKQDEYFHGKSDYEEGKYNAYDEVAQIVNQLAEEYKICYKSCTECEAYDKEKNHCPKFCYIIEETIKEIEENHSGWIPCSDRLPETSGEYYTYVYYDGHYIYSIDEIDCGGIVKEWNCSSDYKILAWKPITPYQPKGE